MKHNTNNNKKFPNLRFKEFEGEWEKITLHSIALITKGTGISKDQLSLNGMPCILYGELYTKYKYEIINEIISRTDINPTNLVKSKVNDVIIPSSGETAIDISTARCVTQNDILLGGDLNIIRLKNDDGCFLSYQLNGIRKLDIAKIAQGVSVVHLYGEKLKHLQVYMPEKIEQKKISSLLYQIDERISTQIKIIEKFESLIKGIYNFLLGESSDYMKLGGLCEIKKGQQVNGTELTEFGEYYVMNGGIAPSGFYNFYNTNSNTISISEGGNSCGYVQYNDLPFWSGGHCYTLENVEGIINDRYLFHYLKANEASIMALRIGSGLPNIQKKDLSSFGVPLPTLTKQKEMANTLDKVVDKIGIEKGILAAYQKQKKFLLQSMFI
ncbi:restriction endonuclease subunit S [Bacteroides sp. K03]|uniref:restriction endonuclease subunit S n=3 Tax=unclassified Bacteroides TaxID=2646097 RepID=UPI002102D8EE|nr:restriction endonuclease subunit S [Bacteroides sp. K03]